MVVEGTALVVSAITAIMTYIVRACKITTMTEPITAVLMTMVGGIAGFITTTTAATITVAETIVAITITITTTTIGTTMVGSASEGCG